MATIADTNRLTGMQGFPCGIQWNIDGKWGVPAEYTNPFPSREGAWGWVAEDKLEEVQGKC